MSEIVGREVDFNNLNDDPMYIAHEIWSKSEEYKSSDVYSFALIMYEILTKESPANMPLFNVDLPDCFKNLILSCYVEDQTKRLSFDQIVDLLKTNHEFIDGKINVHEYLMYVRLIDNCFGLTKKISKNLQNIQNKQDNFNIQNKQDDLNIQSKQDDLNIQSKQDNLNIQSKQDDLNIQSKQDNLNIQSKQDNQRDQYNNESINLYSQKRYMDLNIGHSISS